jgi:hypothetical protein
MGGQFRGVHHRERGNSRCSVRTAIRFEYFACPILFAIRCSIGLADVAHQLAFSIVDECGRGAL